MAAACFVAEGLSLLEFGLRLELSSFGSGHEDSMRSRGIVMNGADKRLQPESSEGGQVPRTVD